MGSFKHTKTFFSKMFYHFYNSLKKILSFQNNSQKFVDLLKMFYFLHVIHFKYCNKGLFLNIYIFFFCKYFSFAEPKNAFLLVLPIEDISHWPELFSPPRFRIYGGYMISNSLVAYWVKTGHNYSYFE